MIKFISIVSSVPSSHGTIVAAVRIGKGIYDIPLALYVELFPDVQVPLKHVVWVASWSNTLNGSAAIREEVASMILMSDLGELEGIICTRSDWEIFSELLLDFEVTNHQQIDKLSRYLIDPVLAQKLKLSP